MRFHLIILLVLLLAGAESGHTAPQVIRRGIVRCPVIGDLETGQYSKSPRKYVCFRSGADAKRYAFTKFSVGNGINSLPTPTPVGGTGSNPPNPTPTAVPTPIPTFVPTPPIAPTPLPSLKSFTIKGTGSGVSQVFLVSVLPGTVSFNAAGAPSDRISIILRDGSTGFYLQQVGFGAGVKSNASTISKKGNVYLDVQATDGMAWAITVSYR